MGEGERRNIPFQKQFHLPGQQYSELQKSKACSNSFCFFGSGTRVVSGLLLRCVIQQATLGFSLHQCKDQSGKSVFVKKYSLNKDTIFLSLEYLPVSTQVVVPVLTQSERL